VPQSQFPQTLPKNKDVEVPRSLPDF